MPRTIARPKPADDSDDAPLKRLGGGRWQTRDERFTIEPQSGTWVIVDAEQTDDFGMALIRGPYPSLTAAKQGISVARTSAPAESPLASQIERRNQPKPADTKLSSAEVTQSKVTEPKARANSVPTKAARTPSGTDAGATPPEPAWLTDLGPTPRGRARRLIARLDDAGVSDAVSIVRRDVLGDVPAVAAVAITRLLADLDDDASPADVAGLLADGRDDALGVRWRLVDGEGRPITLDSAKLRRS